MELGDDLARIAAAAAPHAAQGEALAGVLAIEPAGGSRVFLCAFEASEARSWLVLDDGGEPVVSRTSVREAVSIAALCEIAAETAGGGELEELRAQLVQLRLTESPAGIE